MARTILLTGFEPFDGESENPSWDAVRELDETRIEGHLVAARLMPCVFNEALMRLEAEVARLRPHVVLGVGLAGGRTEISVERVAINLNDARIPDNAGAQPLDQPVVIGGPAAYFSSLPVKAIVRDLDAAQIPAGMSQSAGTYVCNHFFYGACHLRAKKKHRDMRVGFIHVPYSPAQAAHRPGAASLPQPIVTQALRVALTTTLRSKTDARLVGGSLG